MTPCETDSCAEVARYRVHWPGRTMNFCLDCTQRAKRLALHMGFELTHGPIKFEAIPSTHEMFRINAVFEGQDERKPYSKPKLTRYGDVAEITQSVGFISMHADGGGGMGNPSKSA